MSTTVQLPLPNHFNIGNRVYARRDNPDADNSVGENLLGYSGSAAGAFRELKLASGVLGFANQVNPSPFLKNAQNATTAAWIGMGLPHTVETFSFAASAIKNLSRPVVNPTDPSMTQGSNRMQNFRLGLGVAEKLADAGSMTAYTGSFFANCANSSLTTPLKNVGDVLTMAKDTCDLTGAVHDLALSARACSENSSIGTTDVATDLVQTRKYNLLRVAKAIASVIGGIFTAAILLGIFKISAIVLTLIGITASVLAITLHLYRQSMRSKPIDLVHYYDTNRPALPVTLPNSSAAPAA